MNPAGMSCSARPVDMAHGTESGIDLPRGRCRDALPEAFCPLSTDRLHTRLALDNSGGRGYKLPDGAAWKPWGAVKNPGDAFGAGPWDNEVKKQ